MAIKLPVTISRELKKLPARVQVEVSKQLSRPPALPPDYQNAVALLERCHDPRTVLEKGQTLAQAFALYARMHNDTSAKEAALKVEALALRKMFQIAKQMGQAQKMLVSQGIKKTDALRGQALASYDSDLSMERQVDEILHHTKQGHRVSDERVIARLIASSPLQLAREAKASEYKGRAQAAKAQYKDGVTPRDFYAEVSTRLWGNTKLIRDYANKYQDVVAELTERQIAVLNEQIEKTEEALAELRKIIKTKRPKTPRAA